MQGGPWGSTLLPYTVSSRSKNDRYLRSAIRKSSVETLSPLSHWCSSLARSSANISDSRLITVLPHGGIDGLGGRMSRRTAKASISAATMGLALLLGACGGGSSNGTELKVVNVLPRFLASSNIGCSQSILFDHLLTSSL